MYITTTIQLLNWHTGYLRTHRVLCPGNSFPMLSTPPAWRLVPSYFISYHFDKIVKLFYVKRAKGINLQSLCNISDNCICQTTFLNYFLCAPTPLHEDLFLSIWYCIVLMQDMHCIYQMKPLPCENAEYWSWVVSTCKSAKRVFQIR